MASTLLAEVLRWDLILSLLLIAFFVDRFIQYWRLRQFKGPFSTGFSDIWHSIVILGLEAHLRYGEVNDRYGPIARVGPTHLITSSPELWARAYAVRSGYTRSPWYYWLARFEPGKDNVFSQTDEAKHEKRRKQMAAGYGGKENLHLESSIDDRLKDLLQLIRSKYLSTDDVSRPMDLAAKMQYFALDVISDVGLGQSFGDLKADADNHGYIKSAEEGLLAINTTLAMGINWLIQIPAIGRLMGPSEKDEVGFGKMMGTARLWINERLQRPTESRSDMLASFIRHGLNKDELFSESLEQVIAGSDTTAAALRVIMLFVLTTPRVYKKLQAEIDEAVASGRAPDSRSGEVVSDATAKTLPYLQAVQREAMRMHPPVANLFSKVVPQGGDTVTVEGQKYFLPGGVKIGYSAWGMHHSKSIFGDDALVFRPERWFEENNPDKEKFTRMLRTNDLLFGYGKWRCLGMTVAQIEINKAVFEMLKLFDWGIMSPEMPWKSRNLLGLFAHRQMWVTVTERK